MGMGPCSLARAINNDNDNASKQEQDNKRKNELKKVKHEPMAWIIQVFQPNLRQILRFYHRFSKF